MMKKLVATTVAIFCASGLTRAQLVTSTDDIQSWTGTGTNRSALVLQWNDGSSPVSLAWGYRWNGVATGIEMLKSIAGTTIVRSAGGGDVIETLTGADPWLELTIERYGWGDAVYSMVYSSGTVPRTQADWDSGYWEYSLYGGNIEYFTWNGTSSDGPFTYEVSGTTLYASVAWWSSQIGASERLLVNNSWDAWSFAAGFASAPVTQPVSAAAVPEPSTFFLLLPASALIFVLRKLHAT